MIIKYINFENLNNEDRDKFSNYPDVKNLDFEIDNKVIPIKTTVNNEFQVEDLLNLIDHFNPFSNKLLDKDKVSEYTFFLEPDLNYQNLFGEISPITKVLKKDHKRLGEFDIYQIESILDRLENSIDSYQGNYSFMIHFFIGMLNYSSGNFNKALQSFHSLLIEIKSNSEIYQAFTAVREFTEQVLQDLLEIIPVYINHSLGSLTPNQINNSSTVVLKNIDFNHENNSQYQTQNDIFSIINNSFTSLKSITDNSYSLEAVSSYHFDKVADYVNAIPINNRLFIVTMHGDENVVSIHLKEGDEKITKTDFRECLKNRFNKSSQRTIMYFSCLDNKLYIEELGNTISTSNILGGLEYETFMYAFMSSWVFTGNDQAAFRIAKIFSYFISESSYSFKFNNKNWP